MFHYNLLSSYQTFLSSTLSNLWLTIPLFVISTIWIYNELKFLIIKKKCNLNGPKPYPILGQIIDLYTKSRVTTSDEWGEKYGKMYLLFHGTRPVVCIEDPEIIKQITIKDFDVFPNHFLDSYVDADFAKNILMLQDDEWREARALMSTTFTSSKIKRMYKLFDLCCEDLFDCIDEQLDNKEQASKEEPGWTLFKAKETFELFTLNVIATCCYSVRLERSKGQLNFDLTSTRNKVAYLIDEFCQLESKIVLHILAPKFLLPLLPKLKYVDAHKKLASYLQPLIDERKKNPGKYDDYLAIIVNARLDDELVLTPSDSLENHHANLTTESLQNDQNKMREVARSAGAKQSMTDIKILANAIFFIIAGVETTSSLMKNITYCLAFHPDIQHKLYEQIKKIPATKKENGKTDYLDYEHITACEYLDAVISETLRLFSPGTAITRVAKKDYHVKKYNALIPEGTIVDLLYGRVHLDPKCWPEPTKFDPERFMPYNKSKILPGSYAPFGLGPRYCIGMRFGLTESKLALAKLVLNYEFKPIPGNTWPQKPIPGCIATIFHPSNVLTRRRI